MSEAGGTIIGDTAYVIFRNRVPEKPEQPATLIVKKQLAGESPEADKDKEFHFTLTVDGVEQRFTLRPGESKEFEIPAGSRYEVREDDYFQDAMPSRWKTAPAPPCPVGRLPSPPPTPTSARCRRKSKAKRHGSRAAMR